MTRANLGRHWERYHPWLFGLASLVAAVVANSKLPAVTSGAQQLFASTVDVGAIAAGFLGTAKGLLLSFKGTPADEYIQKSGLAEMLAEYLSSAAWAAFFLALASLVAVGVLGLGSQLPATAVAIWFGAAIFTFFAVLRALRVFFKLFKKKAVQP